MCVCLFVCFLFCFVMFFVLLCFVLFCFVLFFPKARASESLPLFLFQLRNASLHDTNDNI